jgi:beta-glucanase (GH16 family)
VTALRLSLTVGAVLLAACAKDEARGVTQPLPARPEVADAWTIAFADEFEGNASDPSKWLVLDADPGHKTTINTASKSMVAVHDGSMFLSAAPTPEDKAFPYAAGYVDTRGLFAQTYGKIEFRARCQYAPGVWYALWGKPWKSLVPEIDIEFLAEDTSQAWFVNHWALPPVPADERRGFTTVNGLDITEFHTYTIVWKPDLIEWQIDGNPFRRVTDPALIPHEPMFWIMNAWVGGWGGTPTPMTSFPAHLEVDHLRVYRLREWVTAPSIQIVNPETTYRSTADITVELADFDMGTRVEVAEGDRVIATLVAPPFRFRAGALSRGAHQLTFVGTGGSRTASAMLAVTID